MKGVLEYEMKGVLEYEMKGVLEYDQEGVDACWELGQRPQMGAMIQYLI